MSITTNGTVRTVHARQVHVNLNGRPTMQDLYALSNNLASSDSEIGVEIIEPNSDALLNGVHIGWKVIFHLPSELKEVEL